MQRVFWASALIVVVIEALLALAFWGGYAWLGGWVAGLAVAAGALVLLALPWIGEVRVAYDSQAQEVKIKVSWWASAQVRLAGERELRLRLRLFGLPLRRKLGAEKKGGPAAGPRADMGQWARRNLCDLLRLALAVLQAGNEIAWGTKELTVIANAPAQSEVLDQIIAGAVGTRTAGPVTLQARPEGRRRVQVRYRIGLRTLAAAGLFVLLQGRARKVSRSLQEARRGR